MFLMKCTISNWKFYKKDNRPSSSSLKNAFLQYILWTISRSLEPKKDGRVQKFNYWIKKERKKSWPRKKGKILTFFSHILLVTENFMNQDNWERGSKKVVLLFHIVWKWPKMSHLSFLFWHFPLIFGQIKRTCLRILFVSFLGIFNKVIFVW